MKIAFSKNLAGWILLLALGGWLVLVAASAQGSLTPPGAPGPTMKTLQQVEPRTPILLLSYTISNSGSYYLTTNLFGSDNQDGIIVTAGDVTLDLNVFVVEGTGNFIFRNTATANSSGNYTNAPGNVVGQILNVSGGATITNANPWANFSN